MSYKKSLLITVSKRMGHVPPCRATWRSTRVSLEAEVGGESMGQSLYCGLHRKECTRQGKQFRVGWFE